MVTRRVTLRELAVEKLNKIIDSFESCEEGTSGGTIKFYTQADGVELEVKLSIDIEEVE